MSRIIELIGNTPLVELRKISSGSNNRIQAKLEFYNPGGSLKDRAALNMIRQAIQSGRLKKGDTIVESSSGNLGVSIAMVSACLGLQAKIVAPDTLSTEFQRSIKSHGAELILASGGNTAARDLAAEIAAGGSVLLNQFDNDDNWQMHYETTGPEIWKDTNGTVTHFITTMGSMGTVTGVSRYLKEKNPNIEIIGVQPDAESQRIPGVVRWPQGYEPAIGKNAHIDKIIDVSMLDAKKMSIQLAKKEGISCGYTSGAALLATMSCLDDVQNAHAVFIVCDRVDRYLSSMYNHV